MTCEAIVICLLLSWRASFSKFSVRWSWLWNAVWSVKNVICLLLSWRNDLDRVVMGSEAIVMCLLLSWRDSFSKLSAWWSWLWNILWPLYNAICLLLSWRNCLDRVVVAGEAIMIGLLLSWCDSRSKLSVWYHDCEMSKSVQISVNCGVRVLRARGARASHALRACEHFFASLPSPALWFSAFLQTFCFPACAYLDQQNSDCLGV